MCLVENRLASPRFLLDPTVLMNILRKVPIVVLVRVPARPDPRVTPEMRLDPPHVTKYFLRARG